MKYIIEEDLQDFEAWSGGKDTLDVLWEYDVVDEAEQYIEEITEGREEPPTETEINDILWFEREEIYRYCGIYETVYGVSDEDDMIE